VAPLAGALSRLAAAPRWPRPDMTRSDCIYIVLVLWCIVLYRYYIANKYSMAHRLLITVHV
jgi:hypothetical protein